VAVHARLNVRPTATSPIVLPYGSQGPRIDPSAWIAPGAVVVGDVLLGADVSIWYGSVLRGDVQRIRIGARTNVQDGAVVHVTRDRFPTHVGNEVTVGHRAVVHGCRVGDRALIGIGAVVLDGAEVGEGALVGAGAVVTPGMQVPPRALVVGTPARVVRSLTDAELAEQVARTLTYVETSRRHAASAQLEETNMVEVKVSDHIAASADAVWGLLEDFGAIGRFTEGLESCTLEGEGVGAVRTIRMPGLEMQERLESFDPARRTLQYAIVAGPLPLEQYLATIAVSDDGDGARIDWSSTFEPKGIEEDQARRMIEGVYAGGIAGMKKALA
jgi:carbonic anhydrase/acetyltransferase-like protein (isoleucine patch superfamily)/carbon monoxide dehydrogenase subunit G